MTLDNEGYVRFVKLVDSQFRRLDYLANGIDGAINRSTDLIVAAVQANNNTDAILIDIHAEVKSLRADINNLTKEITTLPTDQEVHDLVKAGVDAVKAHLDDAAARVQAALAKLNAAIVDLQAQVAAAGSASTVDFADVTAAVSGLQAEADSIAPEPPPTPTP